MKRLSTSEVPWRPRWKTNVPSLLLLQGDVDGLLPIPGRPLLRVGSLLPIPGGCKRGLLPRRCIGTGPRPEVAGSVTALCKHCVVSVEVARHPLHIHSKGTRSRSRWNLDGWSLDRKDSEGSVEDWLNEKPVFTGRTQSLRLNSLLNCSCCRMAMADILCFVAVVFVKGSPPRAQSTQRILLAPQGCYSGQWTALHDSSLGSSGGREIPAARDPYRIDSTGNLQNMFVCTY
mmetsp:Transcript_19119/g.44714  ORF Transcript_19119/g.44714 Transcript_19119/m.44714 type:complete len:231 (-) Transcript_19119:31-723(-)